MDILAVCIIYIYIDRDSMQEKKIDWQIFFLQKSDKKETNWQKNLNIVLQQITEINLETDLKLYDVSLSWKKNVWR